MVQARLHITLFRRRTGRGEHWLSASASMGRHQPHLTPSHGGFDFQRQEKRAYDGMASLSRRSTVSLPPDVSSEHQRHSAAANRSGTDRDHGGRYVYGT